jgi:hypothetical protein
MRRMVLVFLAACGSKGGHPRPRVQVLNGFDVPVSVTITPTQGSAVTLAVPPHGRVPADVVGEVNVVVRSEHGDTLDQGPATMASKDPSEGCVVVYNVLGAAAIESRDVGYGDVTDDPSRILGAGTVSEQCCGLSFVFEQPPDAITVKDEPGPGGEQRGWIGYIGDGDWKQAVKTLLAEPETAYAGQYRNPASQIIAAVQKVDPKNPALPELMQLYQRTAPAP